MKKTHVRKFSKNAQLLQNTYHPSNCKATDFSPHKTQMNGNAVIYNRKSSPIRWLERCKLESGQYPKNSRIPCKNHAIGCR